MTHKSSTTLHRHVIITDTYSRHRPLAEGEGRRLHTVGSEGMSTTAVEGGNLHTYMKTKQNRYNES